MASCEIWICAIFSIVFVVGFDILALVYGGLYSETYVSLNCTKEALISLPNWLMSLSVLSFVFDTMTIFTIFGLGYLCSVLNHARLICFLSLPFAWHIIKTILGAVSLWYESASCLLEEVPEFYYASEAVVISEIVICIAMVLLFIFGKQVISTVSPPNQFDKLYDS